MIAADRRKERGFTLIELLVVVALLGVLSAVAVPNVARFVGRGGPQAAAAERQAMQTAVDVAMSDLKLTSVTAETDVNDFSSTGAKPITGTIGVDAVYLYPDYIRFPSTGGSSILYAWTATGQVTQSGSW